MNESLSSVTDRENDEDGYPAVLSAGAFLSNHDIVDPPGTKGRQTTSETLEHALPHTRARTCDERLRGLSPTAQVWMGEPSVCMLRQRFLCVWRMKEKEQSRKFGARGGGGEGATFGN